MNNLKCKNSNWKRISKIIVDNPYDGVPSITFVEEAVLVIGKKTITKPIRSVIVPITQPDYEFPLIDPKTSQKSPIEKATYLDIYKLLYSAYWDTADE